MIARATAAELTAFRGALGARLGLHFDDTKLLMLANVLERRASALGRSPGDYVQQVRDGLEGELRVIAPELTVSETYFFRHGEQMHAFVEAVLPERLARPHAIRILSAGCASGEEAYSIAILVREHARDASARVAIRAFDLNPEMVERAKAGRYSDWALRETPAAIRSRWFASESGAATVDRSIREAVAFESKNLAREDDDLWSPGTYDVIFCRNVLMYMRPEAAQEIVARMARALLPGGYLFLGHAETLRGVSQDFHLVHTHGTFYYQRKDGDAGPLPPPPGIVPLPLAQPFSPQQWLDTVQRSTERIQVLADSLAVRSELPSPASFDVRHVLSLVADGRFADALSALPSPEASGVDALSLRAVLLVHGGDFERAAEYAQRVLAIDELSSSAQYVLASCRENAGDAEGATEHHRIAAYLDPSFAMPRLHLGLLARRAGRTDDAKREMTRALELLESEDRTRLVLFGGGFGRDGLVALCRAELSKLGVGR